MCISHYSPFLLLETPGFLELLWAPTPGSPLRLCPGDLTAPLDPQLARAMTFAFRHDIIKTQQTFGGGGLRGDHMKFSQIERGDQQFFCCFQGGIKNLTESFIPFLPHPRELKNDNSLTFQNIGLHNPGTRYRSFLLSKISASILLEQDIDPFLLSKISASILLEQDMTYSSEVHNKGDPFSKLLE